MGVTDDIRKAIRSKLIIRYTPKKFRSHLTASCVICSKQFPLHHNLCLYIREDGYVCTECGERFAPEMLEAMSHYHAKDIHEFLEKNQSSTVSGFDKYRWETISNELDAIQEFSHIIGKTIANGIVETPTAYIGLLHLVKEYEKPSCKDDEDEEAYNIRMKRHKKAYIYDKIQCEISERAQRIRTGLKGLPIPRINDDDDENV